MEGLVLNRDMKKSQKVDGKHQQGLAIACAG